MTYKQIKAKVSFDFDNTLSLPKVQQYAKDLIDKGYEVWVVTSRYDENHKHLYLMNATHDDLWNVVDKIGIPKHHVVFTNMVWKWQYLDRTHFLWHLDDNKEEIEESVDRNCNVPMVDVTKSNWKQKCNEILEKK